MFSEKPHKIYFFFPIFNSRRDLMKIRKIIILFTLGLTLVLPISVNQSRTVYAADEIIIQSPKADDWITDQYVLRYTISQNLKPKQIQVSYQDANGGLATVDVELGGTPKYTTLIQGLAEGENILTITMITEDGKQFSNRRRVIVDYKLTNIHSDEENVSPYVTDQNKFKNLLKAGNRSAVQNTKIVPKNDAYINCFVDTLFEEAQSEAIRPDIAFAQIMLETGWLSYQGDVKENQNNFGGLGATGNGVRGNVFISLRDGIRANIQHLLAYASTRPIKGSLTDPRFGYVNPRGNAPAMEYLGYQENVQGGGWAMGFQYGYKLRGLIERLDQASPSPFQITASSSIITEMEVSSISRGRYNALDINLIPGFKVGQEVRLALATNSDSEHRFTFINTSNGLKTSTGWTRNRAAFYMPVSEGLYQFKAEIRNAGSTAILDSKVKEVKIAGN